MTEPLDIRSVLGLGQSEPESKQVEQPPENKPRYVKLEQDHKDLLEMRKNIKKQAENIRKSEHLRCEIYKGVKAGADHTTLLLMALECISSMTGDTVFYRQNADYIKAKEISNNE